MHWVHISYSFRNKSFFSHLKGLISIKEAAAPKKIIIIGAGDSGQSISRQILHQQDKKLELIAIIDDSPKKIGQRLHGVHVLGPIEDLCNLNLNFRRNIHLCAQCKQASNEGDCICL